VINRLVVKNVVLIGGTGSGKTTVGYQLGRLLNLGVFDCDERIAQRAGCDIPTIFEKDGESRFREIESDIIKEIASIRNHVIISGAGAIEADANWSILKDLGPVVWLATPTSEVVRRLMMNPDELRKRPLLREAVSIEDRDERYRYLSQRLDDILQRRLARYQEADHTVTCNFATPEMCAQFVKSILLALDDDSQPQN
jgi:shikimate kinase